MSARQKRAHTAASRRRALDELRRTIVDCERCARLRTYCREVAARKKRAYLDEPYWGRPVPGFGDPDARLLLVGLAPAAHGANRTGRMFTGDGTGGSGDFLMSALHRTGFASIPTSRTADDGLRLTDAYLTAAVRCAPPDNAPTPGELTACLEYLATEAAVLSRVRVVVALGRIAFDVWLRLWRDHGVELSPRPRFAHGASVEPADLPAGMPHTLLACYHPSRQNTHTGRLTPAMMERVFRTARRLLA